MTTTQIQSKQGWASLNPRRRYSETSSIAPPAYEYEMTALTPATSSSSANSLPEYETAHDIRAEASSSSGYKFYPTKSFQLEAVGQPLIAFPFAMRPIPLPVFEVTSDGSVGNLVYESLRKTRHSGSCVLVRADGSESPVCSTTYRFGPGRPPRMVLHDMQDREEFEVNNKSLASRSQIIRTHLGTFEWRYSSRKERKAENADSLLVLEKITKVALAGGGSEERRKKIAQFVRNPQYRTQGSSASAAGNGGRLMTDFRDWSDSKGEAQELEILVIASCIVMLKKELDRRRAHQTIIVMGATGGGGGP